MGFGGTISAMISSLRNNAALLRHRSIFKRGEETRFLGKDPIEFETAYPSGKEEEANPMDSWDEAKKERVAKIVAQRVKELEEERIRKLKNKRLITGIAVPIIVLLVSFGMYTLLTQIDEEKVEARNKQKMILEEQKRQEQVFYLLEDAQLYERKRDWKESILRYEEILKLYPGHGEAQRSIARINQSIVQDSLERVEFKNLGR